LELRPQRNTDPNPDLTLFKSGILREEKDQALAMARRNEEKLTHVNDANIGRAMAQSQLTSLKLESQRTHDEKLQLEVEFSRLQEFHRSTQRELKSSIDRADEAEIRLEEVNGQLHALRYFKEQAEAEFQRWHTHIFHR